MVEELVLAIDPFLSKVEQVILWENKAKSGAVFTGCHFLFWLFLNYNIRTYCTISGAFLLLHLLDAYRAKKRRELIRLQSANKNYLTESLSSIGRFIIYSYKKLATVYSKLKKLKRRNRFLYFLTMLSFWSTTAIIGTRIRGFYLVYLIFWLIFIIPAIVHFDIPKKLLSRALPLLEQLDHSMKYQRRSVLDKSELLVDVKHPNSDEHDEAEEDEYLRSFQLGDLKKKHRRIFDNLEDEESLYSEHTEDGERTEDEEEDDDDEEEEVIEEVFEVQTYRTSESGKRPESETKLISQKTNKTKAAPVVSNYTVKTSNINFDFFDPNNDSLIPDEFLPNVNMSGLASSFLSTTNEDASFDYSFSGNDARGKNIGNMKVMKGKRIKARPSLLDYYEGSKSGSEKRTTPQNERDIDETFDFLDEELDKY